MNCIVIVQNDCEIQFQAIDDDCNQTGQMTASLLDWPQVKSFNHFGILYFVITCTCSIIVGQ